MNKFCLSLLIFTFCSFTFNVGCGEKEARSTPVDGESGAIPHPTDLLLAEFSPYGEMIFIAYEMFKADKENLAPEIPINPETNKPYVLPEQYRIIAYLTAKDHLGPKQERVFYGFVAKAPERPLVRVWRGTSSFMEGIEDIDIKPEAWAELNCKDCLFEAGNLYVYQTLEIRCINPSINCNTYLENEAKSNGLIVTGHSLGAAISTLDSYVILQENSYPLFKGISFAAPKVGNIAFVENYDRLFQVKDFAESYRVYNVKDFVPKWPPNELGWGHVTKGVELNSEIFPEIKKSLLCRHHIYVYLYIMGYGDLYGLQDCKVP